MIVLVLNAGSSSVKYHVIDTQKKQTLKQETYECLEDDTEFEKIIHQVIAEVAAVNSQYYIEAVGHRVVHGGRDFHDAALIDDQVKDKIARWIPLAPLHNPRNLLGIDIATAQLPSIPQVAVFDTAFHATLPRRASTYAIDNELAARLHICRYGFHGTSHQYVALQAAAALGQELAELRIISLHLGNGASACAIEYGHSTETSMGMTPLEGLVMGTRSGDIDAGAVVALLREESADASELDELLNKKSGLLGLSGASNDMRELEVAAAEGDDGARLAIAVFAHRAKKYIGAYAAAMGGVDAIVLTGGIGENSASMRQRILQRLDYLGLHVDEDRNIDVQLDAQGSTAIISGETSRVKALVVKTDEAMMIAQQTAATVKQELDRQRSTDTPGPIPIAVSARHIHLDRATFAQLFGEDAELTHYKDLSQPKQFASAETANLIGPRDRIDGVRLLGPLRSKNQIEISRTDEYLLGVDAPVRDSGKVQGSAPITLEGPKGTVHLSEGLICARRHIHMHPDDAERFGVNNRDEVEVAITGGPRELIFGDVLVRVSPGYRLEMHIDTDEANAAELSKNTSGTLVYTNIYNATATLRAKKTVR